MNRTIKDIAELHNIASLKEEYIRNKELIYKLERRLAKMSLDYKVGKYINNRDKYYDLIEKRETAKELDQERLKKEIKLQGEKLELLDDGNQKIKDYLELEKEYNNLKETQGEYHRGINEDFRYEFTTYEVPNIFIYQGHVANILVAKNIILPEVKEIYEETKDIIIYPPYELKSNREYRHFYNKISFKYLEEISNDYNFELENKKLGKIRIRK